MGPGAPGLEVKMREQTLRYVFLMVLLVAAAGVVCAGQPVNESRPVAPGAEISVENLAGSLTIEGSSGGRRLQCFGHPQRRGGLRRGISR